MFVYSREDEIFEDDERIIARKEYFPRKTNLNKEEVKQLNKSDFPLIGNHNIDNLKAIITILTLLNMDLDVKVLRKFEPLKYHLEEKKINNINVNFKISPRRGGRRLK